MSPDDPGKKTQRQDQAKPGEAPKTEKDEERLNRLRFEADFRTHDRLSRRRIMQAKPKPKDEEPEDADIKGPVGEDIFPERKGEEKGVDHSLAEFGLHDSSHDGQGSHDGGHDGGGHHATGVRPPPGSIPRPQALTLESYMKEAVLRHWDSILKEEARQEGMTPENYSQRRWIFEGMAEIIDERMLRDLREIEERAPQRHNTIRELNILKAMGGLTREQRSQLRGMEDEEALRYWLRDRYVRRAPLEKQKKISWLRPLGRGAVGVSPYTVLTSWDLLTPSQKKAARWLADNYLLRWQNAIVPRFLPKKPSNKWFREKASNLEKLFDDEKEEAKYDKAFRANVRRFRAIIESQEKELAAYDKISADEEKKFAKITADSMKS